MLFFKVFSRVGGVGRFFTVLAAATLCSAALAVPSVLDYSTLSGYDWDSAPINQNALRFVEAGDLDLVPQDGSDPPWNDEGLWATSPSFDFGIHNKTKIGANAETFDNLILLVAYRGDDADFTFSLTAPSGSLTPSLEEGDFGTIGDYPSLFGVGGNRPGDGLASLYNNADGIIFIDLDLGDPLGPGETVEIDVAATGATLPEALHLDAYGYISGSVIVMDTNPNSSDLGWGDGNGYVPEASTMILFGSGLMGVLAVARRKLRFMTGR